MDGIRKLLVLLGLAGAIGFGAALAASFVHPAAVESVARAIIRGEQLTRAFRIFTGTSAVLFALLAVAAIAKIRGGR